MMTVIGLNQKSHNLAKELGYKYKVLAYDPHLEKNFNISFSPEGGKGKAGEDELSSMLKNSVIFYLCGSSTFITNWEQVRENALLVGEYLKEGDWVIFGNDIDPDMAEIALIPILEQRSKLAVGEGFDIAFHPESVKSNNFGNLSHQIKFSHNLIIDKVSLLLSVDKDEFKSFQLSFIDEDYQLKGIKEVIRESWVPLMNGMDSGFFENFCEACINHRFLDKYPELKLSTEWRVDYKRFFKLALDYGLKHHVSTLKLKNVKQAS